MEAEDDASKACRQIIYQKSYNKDSTKIILSQCHLESLCYFGDYQSLKELDLSQNQLSSLQGSGLDSLQNLYWLDLRNNQFRDLDLLLNTLKFIPKLRVLYLEQNPISNYTETCQKALRQCEYIDDEKNPHLLTSTQRKAYQYLLHLQQTNGGGRISATEIDLSNLKLSLSTFSKVMKALSVLPLYSVKLSGNEYEKIPNYRMMLVYYLKHVTVVDDEKVNEEEKENAIRVYKELYQSLKEKNKTEQIDVLQLLSNTGNNNHHLDKQELPQYEGGGWLSKLEIYINFIQLYGLYYDLAQEENWPLSLDGVLEILINGISFNFSSWFEYEEFKDIMIPIACLIMPLILGLYKIRLNKQRWANLFLNHWPTTFSLLSLLLILLEIGIVAFGLSLPTSAQKITFIFTLSFLSCFFYTVFIVFGILFRRRYKQESFWFNILRMKKRMSLFCMTILYMPLNRILFSYLPHLSNTTDPFMWCLIPACLLSILFLPLFFMRLIQKSRQVLYMAYGLQPLLQNIKSQKERKRVEILYSVECKRHQSPVVYLYGNYNMSCAYWKLFLMMQRLLLVFILTFIPAGSELVAVKIGLGILVASLQTIMTIWKHPYADLLENQFECTTQLVNTFLLIISYFIYADIMSKLIGFCILILLLIWVHFTLAYVLVSMLIKGKLLEVYGDQYPLVDDFGQMLSLGEMFFVICFTSKQHSNSRK